MTAILQLPDTADTLRYRIQAQKALPQDDVRITMPVTGGAELGIKVSNTRLNDYSSGELGGFANFSPTTPNPGAAVVRGPRENSDRAPLRNIMAGPGVEVV